MFNLPTYHPQESELRKKQKKIIEKLSEARDLKVDIDNKEKMLLRTMKARLESHDYDFVLRWLKDRTYLSLMKLRVDNLFSDNS